MLGYYDIFPEKTETELRTATFVGESPDNSIPAGTYVFTEYYCPDPGCDCQRVLVKVLRVTSPSARPDEVATISYTWNEQPRGVWAVLYPEMPNPFLDPFHRQAGYADELQDFWLSMVKHDRSYLERLKRHYRELRAEVGQGGGKFLAGTSDDMRRLVPISPAAEIDRVGTTCA